MAGRKRIKSDEGVNVSFTERERWLIQEKTFAGPELTDALSKAELERGRYRVKYTLDDLDELLGFIAAEANHAKDAALEGELDALFERLEEIMNGYDDGNWQ